MESKTPNVGIGVGLLNLHVEHHVHSCRSFKLSIESVIQPKTMFFCCAAGYEAFSPRSTLKSMATKETLPLLFNGLYIIFADGLILMVVSWVFFTSSLKQVTFAAVAKSKKDFVLSHVFASHFLNLIFSLTFQKRHANVNPAIVKRKNLWTKDRCIVLQKTYSTSLFASLINVLHIQSH